MMAGVGRLSETFDLYPPKAEATGSNPVGRAKIPWFRNGLGRWRCGPVRLTSKQRPHLPQQRQHGPSWGISMVCFGRWFADAPSGLPVGHRAHFARADLRRTALIWLASFMMNRP